LNYEIEHIKNQNGKLIDDSHTYTSEIEALNRHMGLVNQQNSELSTELEKFIQTDDMVRRSLNRKGHVEEIRHKVDEAI
jgi:PBP1b-binding outer membrane lipoprotein LpoB